MSWEVKHNFGILSEISRETSNAVIEVRRSAMDVERRRK